ncbi:MAG: endonuclease/exonuclease/phosphatase family protein [Prevotellaceae bacterium]|nr:endonuclease/exonuclease/phosphatase family protein [Prevotellaceae bacterium]
MKHKNILYIAIWLVWLMLPAKDIFAQKQKYVATCVAFYNLENLFDTIKSPNSNDSEFLPDGVNKWTAERYEHKLRNMASVISKIGADGLPSPPAILGVAEIENRLTLEDLIKTPPLSELNYGIVHYDSPDARGVDVGLLYRKSLFRVLGSRSVRLTIPDAPDFRTRDQLVASGLLNGELVHIIVMHWPSRRGGEKRSKPLRNGAAALCRSIVDSLYSADANAKIIIMGDLNDDPDNESLTKILKARPSVEKTGKGGLYNTMYRWFRDGVGSLAWDDSWNLFDQIIVSEPLLGKDSSTCKFYKSGVFNKDFLRQKEGRYAGYPLRTYSGGAFTGGYSDHFPTYIYLMKQL